jgi:tRNA threonylcarbamoyladenosine biosynthesis protein TsaE
MRLNCIKSDSEQQTNDFAYECAKSAQKNDVFLLEGPLGAGKSTFARAFIQYFIGCDSDIPSPTFTLVQTYNTPQHEIWHLDLYRLEDPEEIYELGWEEAIGHHLLLIEWPERLGHLKPEKYKQITITPLSPESRKIEFHQINEGKTI